MQKFYVHIYYIKKSKTTSKLTIFEFIRSKKMAKSKKNKSPGAQIVFDEDERK